VVLHRLVADGEKVGDLLAGLVLGNELSMVYKQHAPTGLCLLSKTDMSRSRSMRSRTVYRQTVVTKPIKAG